MTVTPDLLLEAYRAGVFPMAEHRDDPEMFWVDPRKRGVFPLDGFHISRSLSKTLRKDDYTITHDSAFGEVIDACADRSETWINHDIRRLYEDLHHRGSAHSLEVWQNADLIGGVYGVTIGAAYCGESMFSRRRNASKIALAWLIDALRASGFLLFDTQFLTPHLASLGAIEITRADYHARLAEALRKDVVFPPEPLAKNGYEVVQRNTQTS